MSPLRDLCEIVFGPLANRSRPVDAAEADGVAASGLSRVRLLRGGDFGAFGLPLVGEGASGGGLGEEVYVDARTRARFGVRPTDVLYLAKGGQHRPCLPPLAGPAELPYLVGSSFLLLRIREPEALDREYLFAALGRRDAWRQLERRQEGAYVQSINKGALGDLRVAVPSRAEQRRVVEYARLLRDQRRLHAAAETAAERGLTALFQRLTPTA